ncbi:unnamed protein product [Adineta steineri]|uniref:Cationic amino acid transporter C-terminal domain-containing protein n=1 Tax=Adineta steineri TaxID=433720 RepID=A0A815ISI3_9BILA|nr:unnamed protein product [Adineta steineri]CAF1373881.1 unnamed protein product [Adineta steineri]CAF3567497.1 unnamed protein product [Adineta steineri]CAF3593992.1 unnamed protein product [Adineta steineri]
MSIENNNFIQRTLAVLSRRKRITAANALHSQLRRCLTVIDLTTLGIGSTLGAGIYILAGTVARDLAGPGVILSFLIAGIASLFSGLCYAELGSKYPRAGSAYVYSYVIIGELAAFITGWNLILEYIVGAASAARAWTSSVDSIINFRMSLFFQTNFPFPFPNPFDMFAPYMDIGAFGLTLITTMILAIGVKESSRTNNFCTLVNLISVAIIIISGLFKVNTDNWHISMNEMKLNKTIIRAGTGGFLPYSFSGVLSGAATCFYAFVGFDLVATTGEETENPRRAIPISICLVLFICCFVYCAVSAVLTLIVPYYSIRVDASLPDAFDRVGLSHVKIAITLGAVTGLTSSIIGSLFPLPRVLYSMASDGLLFPIFSKISNRSHTPIYSTLIGGFLAAVMALVFDLLTLVEMLSIGTLIAYTQVALAVLISRYEIIDDSSYELTKNLSSIIVIIIILCFISIYSFEQHDYIDPLILLIFLFLLYILINMVYKNFCNRKQNISDELGNIFLTPFVPWLPIFSIFCNIYLMLKLSFITWVRFILWMIIGFSIYFFYGMQQAGKYLFPVFI